MKTSSYSKCVAHRANTVDQKEKNFIGRTHHRKKCTHPFILRFSLMDS